MVENAPDGVRWIPLERSDLDISDRGAVQEAMGRFQPDAWINAAAYTAVDRAEKEPDLARLANEVGPANLAELAAERGVDFLHVSTDYVFDGTKRSAYIPEDQVNPLSEYGKSKRAGEEAVLKAGGRAWVVRIAWLYDANPPNFLHTMLQLGAAGRSLKVVNDQVGTPTSAEAFAHELVKWAKDPTPWKPGVWHYGHRGLTTWYGFAESIFEAMHMDVDLSPCSSSEYPTLVQRPHYSHLDPEHWHQAIGEEPMHWKEALSLCMDRIKKEANKTN